jgi:hypothetical protein
VAAAGSIIETRSAGTRPNSIVVRTAAAPMNASCRPSALNVRPIGLVGVSRKLTRPLADASATGTATAAPTTARSRLSTTICETTRPRDAPTATRIAISRSRAPARASIRVARFPHVMSRTIAVRPSSSDSDVPCVSRSWLTPRPAGNAPNRNWR